VIVNNAQFIQEPKEMDDDVVLTNAMKDKGFLKMVRVKNVKNIQESLLMVLVAFKILVRLYKEYQK